MGIVKLAGVASALIAGPVLAASNVTFTLGLGADNKAANNKVANPPGTPFLAITDNDTSENQIVGNQDNGGLMTWTVSLSASGVQSAGAGAGSTIKGVANWVFDLELHQGTEAGPLVTTVDFVSTLHDGGSNCGPSADLCPACLAGAAFAFNYNVLGQAMNSARIVDQLLAGDCVGGSQPLPDGGPNMSVYLFPTVPPASGKILGMGAGYSEWHRTSFPSYTKDGVGIPTGSGGLGTGPVAEGQIDISGLAPGTYVLKVIPGAGVNVLRGDINLNQNANAFATAADSTTGDTITFEVINGTTGGGTDVALVSAKSRKVHGGSGTHDIDLPLTGTIGIESRSNGPTKVVLGFDAAVQATGGGAITCANVALASGTCSTVSGSGTNELIVDLTGSTPAACQTLTLNNIENIDGGSFIGPNNVKVRSIFGDANADATVNIVDLNDVKSVLFAPVTGGNFRRDVNADGVLNIVDLNDVKGNLFASVFSCP